ncbi:MAG: hypothetical protein QXD66_03075 [Candidatus Nezhaarchaeales archaeon]|nr:MAG: hypothetical protein DSO06_01745 [Candidatus Nezhaarchaeota archaeon WYZ-LMO8]TDA36952.1 MAG: hypothetical protein DSO05_01705 [Candidatus Nezhaarchaeota archaeon WYZ-LMO7]
MPGRKALSSLPSIMIMAVLLSLSLSLFASLLSSFNDYASTLRKEIDVASEIVSEEKVAVEASSNGTHIILSLTNNAAREVTFNYIVFKHGEMFQINRTELKVPPSSSVLSAYPIPRGFSNPLLEIVLVAKRGTTYRIALHPTLTGDPSFDGPYVKVPYSDICLINDVDVVDSSKGIVVASYENGGVLMVDVKKSSLLWSKEYLGSRTESVIFNEALNATIASISTARESGTKILSVVAFRDGNLVSLHNFYDYIYRSSSVREHVHQPALSGRSQDIILVPKSFFSGNYSTNNYWLFESGAYAYVIKPSSPSIKEVLLQRVLMLDVNTKITPGYYQSNPEAFPKFRIVGYAPVNQSFSILLVNGAIYREVDVVYVRYRCSAVVEEGGNVLVPPTLHAFDSDSPSWYLSLYPCDLSVPNFLACINDVIVVASGPYLYFVSIDGQVLKRIDYDSKVLFLKLDENYRKLIIGLTNGSLMVLNGNLEVEKSFSLGTTSQIIDVVLTGSSRVIVLNETYAFSPEDDSYIVALPSKPYKAVMFDTWGVLVASPSGLLYLKF